MKTGDTTRDFGSEIKWNFLYLKQQVFRQTRADISDWIEEGLLGIDTKA